MPRSSGGYGGGGGGYRSGGGYGGGFGFPFLIPASSAVEACSAF